MRDTGSCTSSRRSSIARSSAFSANHSGRREGRLVETQTLASFANLRDLGGHVGAHGKTLRRGRVYRSANLASDSHDVIAQLAALGVTAIVDLRANKERETRPTPWAEMGCKDYWCQDHTSNAANLV